MTMSLNSFRRYGQSRRIAPLLPIACLALSVHALWAGDLRMRMRIDKPRPALAPADAALAADAPADRALQEGRVDDAAALLRATLAANPGDAVAHQLLCRVFYAQDMADRAIQECELAVSNTPASSGPTSNGAIGNGQTSAQASVAQMWLGRAYGFKAERTNPILGYRLAKKAHMAFERAVELDPGNVAAIGDLGEFYVSAPSFLGGGLDRAEALAARVMPRYPAAAHRLLALIALDGKDTKGAEAEFKKAVDSAHDSHAATAAWIDLARLYAQHDRPEDAVRTVRSAVAVDRAGNRPADAAVVDAATILTGANREPQLAERLLRDYLASPAKSDAAPAFKVHLQLSRLLMQRGDSASAQSEVAAAAALAAGFAKGGRSAQGS